MSIKRKFIFPTREVIRVVDGDTYVLMLDTGFNSYRKIELRLDGIDTHEIHGDNHELAVKEKEFVEDFFNNAEELYVTTKERLPEQGSFNRWLGDIENGKLEDLGSLLRQEFENIDYGG